MTAAKTDAELCRAAAQGRTEAFTELVRRYQSAVCAVTFAVTGRRDLSEDLAQETFLIAWRKLRTIDAPARVAGWLIGIARNVSRNANRERGVAPLLDSEAVVDEQIGVEQAAVAQETRNRIWDLLSALPCGYREAMVLYYREEQSTPRVSELLGISVSAAEQRLSRGRKMLRNKLDREVERELSASAPGDAFTRRVAAALPVGLVGPGAASIDKPFVLSSLGKVIAMNKLLSATIAVVATLVVGYGIFAIRTTQDDPAIPPRATAAHESRPEAVASHEHDVETGAAGIVVAAETGAPLAGAVVALMKPGGVAATTRARGESSKLAVARTDEEGSWEIVGLEPGRYFATAAIVGRLPGKTAAFEIHGDDMTTALKLDLAEGGLPVTGIVSDVGGGPVEGAAVRATLRGGLPVAAITDEEGRYRMQLAEGWHGISVWDLNYQEQTKRLNVQGRGAGVDFELVPAATMTGRVVERSSGRPVEGAVVSFERVVRYKESFSSARSSDDEIAVTDEAGRFTLRRLSPAEYKLYAVGDHLATRAPVEVAVGIADQIEGIVVPVDPAFNARGRVFDEGDASQGIAQARVRVFSTGVTTRAETDASGAFELQGLLPGKYPLTVEGEGMIASPMKVTFEVADADVDDLDVAVERGVEVSGRLDPPRAADVRIALRQKTGGFEVMLQGQKLRNATSKADEEGFFRITAVPRGDWKVVGDGIDGSHGELDVSVSENGLDDVRMELSPRPVVRGTVVDAQGEPVRQATVRLHKDIGDPSGPQALLARHHAKTTTTDEEGGFELLGLEAGRYRLGVADRRGTTLPRPGQTHDDPGERVEIDAESLEDVVLSVELPSHRIAGTVRDAEGSPQPDAWVELAGIANNLGPSESPVAVTNAAGHFSIEALAEGSYDLQVRSSRGDALAMAQDVAAGNESVELELELEALGSIRGVVLAGGRPVTTFEVDMGDMLARTFAAENGRFELPRVLAGHPVVTVTAQQGSYHQRVVVQAGRTAEVSFELGVWASVSGRAVRPNGEPATGLDVMVRSAGGTRAGASLLVAKISGEGGVATDSDGQFTVEGVGAGRGMVSFHDREGSIGGGTRLGGTNFFVEAGGVVDVGEIVLLDDEVVPRPQRGILGLRVKAAFDRPTVDNDDDRPPLGAPTGEAQLWVSHVEPDGRAAARGVKAGQRIVSIDGHAVADLGAVTASVLLSRSRLERGRRYTLVLETDARSKTVVVEAAPAGSSPW